MFDLWQYQNALGEPGKGVHSYRFMGVAIVDVIMTIIGAYILHYYSGYNFWIVLGGLFLLGIFLHRLFHVRTTVDQVLFGK